MLYKKYAKKGLVLLVEPDKEALGKAAALYAADKINATVAAKGHARVIVATGASQFEFIDALVQIPGLPWDKVTCFHLDERGAARVSFRRGRAGAGGFLYSQ